MALSVIRKEDGRSDDELIQSFKTKNDVKALGTLYNRYMELVYGLCLKYFKNVEDSKDAVMDVYELISRKLKDHDVQQFKSWLYRVASNHCLDKLRQRSRNLPKEMEAMSMYSEDIDRPTIDEDESELTWEMLEKCLDSLKEDQRKTIDLFYLQQLSYREVADALGISWSETRSNIQNGRRNLKICLEQK